MTDKAKSKGIDPVDLRADNNDPSSFYTAIGEAKANNDHGAFVTQHEVAEYEGMKTFLNADGSVGVAVTADGNIVSVFKNDKTSTSKRAMSSILLTALENGGVKLDNFGSDALSNMYLQHGFIPVARTAFVDEFAPSDWNYERDGRPDIIFWVHNGDSADAVLDKIGTYERPDYNSVPMYDDYDAAEAARDAYLEEHPVQQATQERSDVRTLTDAEVADIRRIVRDIGYRGNVVFIDDPDADDASFNPDGTVTINRANITGAEADELASNPGFWLLKHEWSHFIEGVKEYAEYAAICRRIMQVRLGDSGYVNAMQRVVDDYAARGVELTSEQADREMVAKFGESDELFSNQESIDMFVREQKGLASRFYNWLQYKINEMKLRRKKDSAVAREILKAERLYAQAFRKANTRPTRDTSAQATQYAIKRTTNNRPFVEIDEDILNGVPQDLWQKTVVAEIKRRFKGGFDVNGQHFDVSTRSANELTRSKDTENAKRTDQAVYADKLRTASNLDEITEASTDYVNEELHHNQKGNIASFGRGQVLFRIGGRDYKAEVLVGNRADGSMLFYDVVKVAPTTFTEKELKQPPVTGGNSAGAISLGAASGGTAQFSGSSLSGAPQSGDSTNYNTQNARNVNTQNSRRATGSSWNDLVKQYGAKPQGMDPRARDIQVPKQVDDNRYVSKFSRSYGESNKATDAQSAEIESEIGSEADRIKQLWWYIHKEQIVICNLLASSGVLYIGRGTWKRRPSTFGSITGTS